MTEKQPVSYTFNVKENKREYWEPLSHPRDDRGRFIKVPGGTYKYGRTSVASFRALMGPEAPDLNVSMDPGDRLYRTELGNFYVKKADDSYVWYANGYKTPRKLATMDEPVGAKLIDENKAISVKAGNIQEAALKVDREIDKYLTSHGKEAVKFRAPIPEHEDMILTPDTPAPELEAAPTDVRKVSTKPATPARVPRKRKSRKDALAEIKDVVGS